MLNAFAEKIPTGPIHTGPFEQILEREQQHETRERDALAAFDQERTKEEDSIRAEQDAKIDEARNKGDEDLASFERARLPQLVKEKEERAAHEITRIEREGTARIEAAAKHIVDTALSPELPSLF